LEEFYASIRSGNFKIPICTSCKKYVWPPSQYCPSCLSGAQLKSIVKKGTLLEFTKSHIGNTAVIFGVVEICGVRLVGRLSPATREFRSGMKVRMARCGIDASGNIFYDFESLVEE
jgi:uncharacterized OB-fold protein